MQPCPIAEVSAHLGIKHAPGKDPLNEAGYRYSPEAAVTLRPVPVLRRERPACAGLVQRLWERPACAGAGGGGWCRGCGRGQRVRGGAGAEAVGVASVCGAGAEAVGVASRDLRPGRSFAAEGQGGGCGMLGRGGHPGREMQAD